MYGQVIDTTYEGGVSDAAKMNHRFLKLIEAILLSTDVDLTTDSVDLGIET